MSKGTTLL